MKRRARFLIAIALGGIAACAGSNVLEQRVTALEERLKELEPHARDAGTEDVSAAAVIDASAEETHRLKWRPDRDAMDPSRDWGATSDARIGPTGPLTIGMGPLPDRPLERCLQQAREACAGAVSRGASGDAGDKFVWQRNLKGVKPEDNAAGRACLATENAKCKADPLHNQRGARLKRWLDQQLLPNRLDKAASAEITEILQRVASTLGVAGPLEVVCVTEFCRVTGGDDDQLRGNLANHLIGYPASQVLRFGNHDPVYVARDSWRFPTFGR